MELYTPSKPIEHTHASETTVALRRIRQIAASVATCNSTLVDRENQKVLLAIKVMAENALASFSIFQDDDHHYR